MKDSNNELEQNEKTDRFELRMNLRLSLPSVYRLMFDNCANLYGEHLRYKNMLKNLYYELENVKGYDYTKQKHTFIKEEFDKKRYKLSSEIEDIEKKDKFIKLYINSMVKIKNSIKDDELRKKIEIAFFEL